MLRIPKRSAVTGFSSTFIFPTRRRPAISDAICSTTGEIMRQGPHHGAHMSSSTGNCDSSTSREKLASVTVIGSLEEDELACESGSGFLHFPQTGLRPSAIFSRGTLLVAAQFGQVMRSGSGMAAR